MERFTYSVPEAAEALGLSPGKVRDLVRAGRLRVVKASDSPRAKWLVTAESMREFATPVAGGVGDE